MKVESFVGDENTLAVRIEKEIGPETGIIKFRQVAFMSLPTYLPGESIRSRLIAEAEVDFWSRCKLDRNEFDKDDILFEIESQDGPVYFVVAKSLDYEILAEPGVAPGRGGT
ncbi:MAG: hypothetical protein C0483_04940 [Pirellula sp.]|nr:hypothetical protein [Pirellula sp.]